MKDLAKHCHNLRYPGGSDIYVKSSDRYIYVIKTGKVSVVSENRQVGALKQFEYFGARDIFGMETEAKFAKADGECIILRIPEPLIDTLLKDIKEQLIAYAHNQVL